MDKLDRLFDALEHPENYTSEEIETMLRDAEVKETLVLLDKTKSSLQPIVTPDIESEWKKFEKKHRNKKRTNFFLFPILFPQKIAAGIAIVIASLTAVAAIVGVGMRLLERHEPDMDDTAGLVAKEITAQPDSIVAENDALAAAPAIVVFDNESFEAIITGIAAYYGVAVRFETDKSKSLRLYYRWNHELPIEEVVESLNNFEQIHISLDGQTIKID